MAGPGVAARRLRFERILPRPGDRGRATNFARSCGHWLSAGSDSHSPPPWAPFSKMCISAGTLAWRSAR